MSCAMVRSLNDFQESQTRKKFPANLDKRESVLCREENRALGAHLIHPRLNRGKQYRHQSQVGPSSCQGFGNPLQQKQKLW